MIELISEWIYAHRWWLAILSATTFVGSLVVIPVLVVRMPADYFVHTEPPPESWRGRHPLLRLLIVVVKNAFGIAIVLGGIAMLVAPGQGVLTILIGLTLLNFPGKRALELRIVEQPAVYRAINWMRDKADRPHLRVP